MDEWDDNIIQFIELIRAKCVNLSQKHTASFFAYKKMMNIFDIPIIILSVFSSFISVGISAFVSQPVISITTASISMAVTILGSIKLYMNLTINTATELTLSKDFHILAMDISRILFTPTALRKLTQTEFLDDIYNRYIILLENSSLIKANEERTELNKIIQISPKSPTILQPRNPLISPKNIIIKS